MRRAIISFSLDLSEAAGTGGDCPAAAIAEFGEVLGGIINLTPYRTILLIAADALRDLQLAIVMDVQTAPLEEVSAMLQHVG